MNKFIKTFLIVLILIFAAGIQSAHALAKLRLSDGINPEILIVDGDENDTIDAEGGVGYMGSVGNFFLNITTAVTYPILGSTLYPYMDLHSTNISSIGGGILTVSFTQTGYNEIRTPQVLSMVGGTSEGNLNFSTYIDNNNTEFGMDTEGSSILISSLSSSGAGAYNDSAFWDVLALSDPFSMTSVATIDHSFGTNTSSFELTVVAPEPVSSVLFLVGGAALGIRRFRKKK